MPHATDESQAIPVTCVHTPRVIEGWPARSILFLMLGYALTLPSAQAQDARSAITLPTVPVMGTADRSDRVSTPKQTATLSKTDTKLADIPASIQVIPRALLSEQGANMLRDAVYNASGVNFGGQDSKGYYDHFLIRGLNAQIY